MKSILILLLCLSLTTLFAQEKREIERNIAVDQVPPQAVNWFNNVYENSSKVTWYEEINPGRHSYEAKLKWRGKWHSVEFNNTGKLEDIEVRLHKKELPQPVEAQLRTYFKNTFTKHKVIKIQQQWSGDTVAVAQAVHGEGLDGVIIRYEIEFYGKNSTEDGLWEGVFDDRGQLISKRKIVLRSAFNMTY